VVAISPDGEALVFVMPSEHESPEKAQAAFFVEGGLAPGEPWRSELNGLKVVSSWFALRGEQSSFVGIAAFAAAPWGTFELYSLVTVEGAPRHGPAIEATMQSFSSITSPAHAAIEPMRVRIVELEHAGELSAVVAEHPSSVDVQTLARLNRVEPTEQLAAGRLVKLVVGFNPAAAAP
jgi:predicted Zn-dependent protease